MPKQIEGHIIEQQRPPLKKANNAILPVVNNPISIASILNPKILSVKAGLSFPAKNLFEWLHIQQTKTELKYQSLK